MSEPPEQIIHRAVKLYRRGMICPAEVWHITSDVIAESADPDAVQNLPASLRDDLAAVYAEAPGSLNVDAEPRDVRRRLYELVRHA